MATLSSCRAVWLSTCSFTRRQSDEYAMCALLVQRASSKELLSHFLSAKSPANHPFHCRVIFPSGRVTTSTSTSSTNSNNSSNNNSKAIFAQGVFLSGLPLSCKLCDSGLPLSCKLCECVQRAIGTVCKCELSRGLTSPGIASATDEMVEKKRQMLQVDETTPLPTVDWRTGAGLLLPTWTPAPSCAPSAKRSKEWAWTLWVWRANMREICFICAMPLHRANCSPQSATSQHMRNCLLHARACKESLRTLMCGFTFTRLIGTTLAAEKRELISALTGDTQFVVGRPAGFCAFRPHNADLAGRGPRSGSFLQFDAVSAFNNMSRERVLDRVREVVPHSLNWAASIWLMRESTAVLTSASGEPHVCTSLTKVTRCRFSCSRWASRCAASSVSSGSCVRKRRKAGSTPRPMAMVSFLDDITLAIGPPLAAQVRQVVTEELHCKQWVWKTTISSRVCS